MDTKVEAKVVAETSGLNQLLELDETPWYKKKNLRRLYLFLVPSALGVEMTSGYDGSVVNGLQAVEPWQEYFNYPEGASLGIMSAAISIGGVMALPFIPWFNDRYGRKACIVFGSIIMTVGVIIQTSAINIAMFVVARIILGMGVPFAISGASQLLAELTYPRERSVITGLFNDCLYVGSILAAGITYGTYAWDSDWSWRLPSLFQFLPSLLQLSFIWFVPESPRWLVSKERYDEALAILVEYHAEGDSDSEFARAEFMQIRDTIRIEKEASRKPWAELFQGANRRRVLVAACVGLFSQWSGNGIISYYLSKVLASVGIDDKKTQNQINLGLSCFNLVAACGGSFLTKYLPRRTHYLTTFAAMTALFACWTAASAVYANDDTNAQSARAVVALIFLYNGVYGLMMPLTYVFVTELFPYIHRSKGVVITQLFTRAPNAFNQFVNPIALASIGWHYYIVYVAWLAVETGVIYFVYPETKGPSLEEVALVVEGNGANVAPAVMSGKLADEEERV